MNFGEIKKDSKTTGSDACIEFRVQIKRGMDGAKYPYDSTVNGDVMNDFVDCREDAAVSAIED